MEDKDNEPRLEDLFAGAIESDDLMALCATLDGISEAESMHSDMMPVR